MTDTEIDAALTIARMEARLRENVFFTRRQPGEVMNETNLGTIRLLRIIALDRDQALARWWYEELR